MLVPSERGLFGTEQFAARTPSLINSAQGADEHRRPQPVQPPFYDDNLPLRDEPPRHQHGARGRSRSSALSTGIPVGQPVHQRPLAFARRLRQAPPPGVPVRPFLLQFATQTDQNISRTR